ncbi:putative type I secretion outer membrane TolC protein [Thiomonas sp. X19]|uniref:TolC family outer membrane protein n=1 Tax=Thiomonas sp. X19 TaxID=1050370 RepID=UPI000B73CD8F|nr:TolC family outer membrane protein [Thiomonas sp. X19]SCC93644.1 putative type I secretion outer membrane TolC protein [Thiomonas sp. X19]
METGQTAPEPAPFADMRNHPSTHPQHLGPPCPRASAGRRRQAGKALALALGVGVAGAARAETLIQVFAQAQQYSPALRSAQANYQAALSRVPLARSRLLPQIAAGASLSGNAQNNSENPLLQRFGFPTRWDYVARDINLTATQALYRPADGIGVSQADIGARIAYTQLAQENQHLMVRVAAAYFDVLAAQDSLRSLQEQDKAIVRQLESAKRNFAAGNGTIVDVRDAQARDDLTGARVIAAQNQVALAYSALQQLTGRMPGRPAGLMSDIRLPAPAGDAQSWAQAAENRNLAVEQARLAVDDARLEAKKAATGRLPTVDAYARLDHASTSGGSNLFPFGNRADVASIGVQIQVPIFTGHGVQSHVQETAHLLDKSQADLDTATLAAAQSARAAYLGLESGRAQVKALQAAVQSSQSSLQANETGYKVGVRVNIDVLNVLSQLFEVKRQADKARYDVLVSDLKLKFAAGELSQQDLDAVNALLQPDVP